MLNYSKHTHLGTATVRILTVAVFLFTPFTASADEQLLENLKGCRLIADDMARLQCYDTQLTPSQPVAEEPEPEPVAAQDRPATVEADPINLRPPQSTVPDHQQTVAVEKKDELGEKYLKQEEDDQSPKTTLLSLTKADKDSRGRWKFYFANGQIWRQLEPGYLSIPENFPLSAEITKGFLGSHKLRIGENRLTTKVKRLK